MIEGLPPAYQALLGTLLTWGLTALGSALVFILDVENEVQSRKILDTMLGFAAGVMLAASYWSLLAPAIEIAESMPLYGSHWSWFPAAVGFALGAVTMFIAESCLPIDLVHLSDSSSDQKINLQSADNYPGESHDSYSDSVSDPERLGLRQRRGGSNLPASSVSASRLNDKVEAKTQSHRRVLLLVAAITIHNFPEGLAVGVGFGSIGQSEGATFQNAVNLAIGIGLQNFPEGLAVSMPLRREGMSPLRAFMWGQLSGLVEPIGGLLGAQAVVYVAPILPYALAFAAGCMIFVVVDDLIPEATQSGNQKLSTFGTIVGFLVMMIMDVALG